MLVAKFTHFSPVTTQNSCDFEYIAPTLRVRFETLGRVSDQRFWLLSEAP